MELLRGDLKEITGKNWKSNLFSPVKIYSLVIFRMVFGSIMLWETTRYFDHGWISRYWVDPGWNFAYAPFNFIPAPESTMYLIWYLIGLSAIFIILGLFYRVATVSFFCLFTYTYLLEQGRYMNHFYLVVLLGFLVMFLPLNKYASVDAMLWPRIKTKYVSAYNLWLARFIIAVPYFFGGIAKINPDWLRGYPLKIWLLGDMDFPIIGKYFDQDWMIYFMSYSGLLLDISIVPLLLMRKTRVPAFIMITLFHLMNSKLFTIGIFPWFMIFATTIFFDPDWPQKIGTKLFDIKVPRPDLSAYTMNSDKKKKIVVYCLATFVAIQVLLPFRHLLIPGNVHWTEGGHRYSWHMKLRSKSGYTTFFIEDKQTGERFEVNAEGYIDDWQIDDMDGKPYMIWEFAQYLKEDFALMGADVRVYVDAVASLNGREYQQIVDPNVDLGDVPRPWFGHADWIVPLYVPLSSQRY